MTHPLTPSRWSAAFPYLIMAAAPAFFSTNLVFGRGVANVVDPFVLAFIRWTAVALLLSPFVIREWEAVKILVIERFKLLLMLGFMGMWISGAIVYLALQKTTATNGTLIYTTSPVVILLIEALFMGRKIGLREIIGMLLAFLGVVLIVLRGDVSALLDLEFNSGDLMMILPVISWAVYSVLYRTPSLSVVSNMTLFGIVAASGAVTLLPVIIWQFFIGSFEMPQPQAWPSIAGIVVFSSLVAFSLFQYGIRTLGPSISGIFMYLLPPYGVLLAWLVLGEEPQLYHLAGIIAVVGGISLATFPVKLLAAWRKGRKT